MHRAATGIMAGRRAPWRRYRRSWRSCIRRMVRARSSAAMRPWCRCRRRSWQTLPVARPYHYTSIAVGAWTVADVPVHAGGSVEVEVYILHQCQHSTGLCAEHGILTSVTSYPGGACASTGEKSARMQAVSMAKGKRLVIAESLGGPESKLHTLDTLNNKVH